MHCTKTKGGNMNITQEQLDKVTQYQELRDELSKEYRYQHAVVSYDSTSWVESVGKLSDILYMTKEHLIERTELIEEV
jgi:hypothetical protein